MRTTYRVFLMLSAASLALPAIASAAPPPAAPPAAPPPPATAQPATAQPVPPPPDLPPPPPPPWTTGPGTSTAGTDVTPPTQDGNPPTAPTSGAPQVMVDAAAMQAQNKRIAALEQDLAAMRQQDRGRLGRDDLDRLGWLRSFRVSGYVQPQLLMSFFDAAASPNAGANGLPAGIGANDVIAKADGTTTNPIFFRLRRARLKTEFMPTEHARFVMELDPTSVGGPSPGIGTIARNVEATGIINWSGRRDPDVVTEIGMGIFKVPFGREVLESDADRPFIERSWWENNMFPGEYDTGARTETRAFNKALTLQAAVVNGAVQGEKTFAILPDLNKGKDVSARVNYNLARILEVGASGYIGQGQAVDAVAIRFKQFQRWAFDFEIGLHNKFVPALGETRVFAELARGNNMDRGTKYAFAAPSIPADINGAVQGHDELGYMVRLEQDFTPLFTLGLRYDFYTPDSAQGNNGRDTFAAVGVIHFTKGLKWMLEYGHATDNVHAPSASAPSKHIDTLSSVLQARF